MGNTHSVNFEGTRRQRLLDQTLVVLGTEFRRTPCINVLDQLMGEP